MVFRALFEKLKAGLRKTKDAFASRIKAIFSAFRKLDQGVIDQLEEAMIGADIGVEATTRILDRLQRSYKEGKLKTSDQALAFLKQELKDLLRQEAGELKMAPAKPTVVLVVGVNGTGKTTSIAKLARLYKERGLKVMICASDTFRAAAVDQLAIWAERVGVDIVKHAAGGDPAAVTFDAVEAATARGHDLLIIDTAGRLQTKDHLMRELGKIRRVIEKRIPDGPHETLLVLDATTGQNALSQAEHFKEVAGLTGIVLAKLDGTAKGGIVVALKEKLALPVKYVGLGEGLEDIAAFDPDTFVDALLD